MPRLTTTTFLLLVVALTNSGARGQVTPGYNNKIPAKIMTPDTVQTKM